MRARLRRAIKAALTLTLSRRTGRGDQTIAFGALALALSICVAGTSFAQGSDAFGVTAKPAAPDAKLTRYQTRHYSLNTDVEPELARDLATRLDAMYDEYARRLNAFGEPQENKRYDVYVFKRRIDYMKFIDDRVPNSGGVFIPSRDILAAYLEGQGRDAMRRTLQHEAFHQFAHSVISPDLPPWINEGMAQLFEEGIWTGEKFIVEQVPPRRLRQLLSDLQNDRLIGFEDFVSMDHPTWGRSMRDRDRGAAQYNQAWAMVHFLVYARSGEGKPAYREFFFEMLKSINGGMESGEAFRKHFGVNFAGFEKRFAQYARRMEASRESTYMENVEVLADMMLELRDDERVTFSSFSDFRRHVERGGYQLHYTKGQLRWSSNADVKTYFRDLDGRDMPSNQLTFIPNGRAPLPDLVSRPSGDLEYRARFYLNPAGKVEREIIVRGE